MSGFAGIISLDQAFVDPLVIQQMSSKIAYRGRDASGIFADTTATLIQHLHNTTSLARNEPTPLTIENCTIICDARIDARSDLIARLRGKGQNVSLTTPDDALILYTFLAFGQNCVDYLAGDFSFAIWDARNRTLFAVRDQIGRCNFYYAQTPQAVIFGNELRPVKLYPGVDTELDQLYIADFLMLGEGFWIDKASTPFSAIRRLERGHTLVLQDGHITIRKYWSLPMDQPLLRYRREEDYIEHFRSIFRDAVQDRLRAQKVVVTLSGGMDSSTVTSTVFDLIRSGVVDAQPTVLTSVYEKIDDQEGRFSKETAQYLGIAGHHVFYGTQHYRLMRPYIHIANAIRQNFTPDNWVDFQRVLASYGQVALYGYLGDTLHSDVPASDSLRRMNPIAFIRAYQRLSEFFNRRLPLRSGLIKRLRGGQASNESYSLPPWLNPDFERSYHLRERWMTYWQWVDQIGQSSRNPYLFRILTNYDYYTHDESDAIDFTPVDNVDPFADLRVINFLASLPPLPWGYQKYLLRRAGEGKLPSSILRRSKYIFGDLIGHLLQQPENLWVDTWQPSKALDAYIVRSNIPKIAGQHARVFTSQAVHMRPLALDFWLSAEGGQPLESAISSEKGIV